MIPNNFEAKKELNISGSVNVIGLHANTAYSITDHAFVHAEGSSSPTNLGDNKMNYNLGGGAGYYTSIGEKWKTEAQLNLGAGRFDWSSPWNGMSEPSSINFGRGDYTFYGGSIAFIHDKSEGQLFPLSLVIRMNQVNLNYEKANPDYLNNTSIQFIQGGPYLVIGSKSNKGINFFCSVGIEGTTANLDDYTYTGLFLRYGMSYKFNLSKKIPNSNL